MSAFQKIKQVTATLQLQAQTLNLNGIKIGSFSEQIKKHLEKFKKVKILQLNGCQLTNIDNLPSWKLTAIDLSSNKLGNQALAKLGNYSSLIQILLVDNQVDELDALKRLFGMKKLQEVDFTDNPVTALPNYRASLFDNIKTLQIVDRFDCSGNQVNESEDQEQEEYSQGQEEQDDGSYDDQEEQESISSDKKGRKRRK